MRWAQAIVFFSFVYSVLSSNSDEPTVIIKAKSSVNNVGEQKGIFCEGNNLIEPMEWYTPLGKKVEPKSSTNTRVFVENHEPQHYLALIIKHTKVEDSGIWTCKSGEQNTTIKVIVGLKVHMPVQRESFDADEGKSVKLNCEAVGNPRPMVAWYFESAPITEDPTKYSIYQKGDTYTLEIKNLSHTDSGEYVCRVTQKALSHYTYKTIVLTIHHKPLLFDQTTKAIYYEKVKAEEVFAVVNSSKDLTCSAIANPAPRFKWFRTTKGYDAEITDDSLISKSEDGMSSTFKLRMMSDTDKGQYKCIASNSRGKVSYIFDVTPGEKPEPPIEITFVEANSTYLTFNVTSNGTLTQEIPAPLNPENLPIVGYNFELTPSRKGYSLDWEDAESFYVAITSPEDTVFTVGPLSNNTEYAVRVQARNLAGDSDWLELVSTVSTTAHAIRIVATHLIGLAGLIVLFY